MMYHEISLFYDDGEYVAVDERTRATGDTPRAALMGFADMNEEYGEWER